jgi:hypothetical protein
MTSLLISSRQGFAFDTKHVGRELDDDKNGKEAERSINKIKARAAADVYRLSSN